MSVHDEDDDPELLHRLRDPRFNPAERTCLGPDCRGRRAFRSGHAGERICPRCREIIGRLYGIEIAHEDAAQRS